MLDGWCSEAVGADVEHGMGLPSVELPLRAPENMFVGIWGPTVQ